jgi:hypothetical protein
MAVPISEIMATLPVMMQYIQVIAYVVLLLFFGSFAMRGWTGWLPWFIKWPARIGLGFLCLIIGIALGPFVTGLNTGIMKIMQLDLFAMGLISAVVFAIGLFLISHRSESTAKSLEKQIERLQKRMKKAKGREPSRMFTIVGVALIAGMLIFGLVNFRGFPAAMDEEIFSSLGIPPELAQMSQECMTAMAAMASTSGAQPDPEPYQNDALKASIEAGAGKAVSQMARLEVNGNAIVVGMMEDGSQCFATESDFCLCPEI